MKFVSKQSNLRVVLKPGIPREPLSGRSAVAGVYVKFEDGIAVVNSNEIADMLRNHPSFGRDFIVLEENDIDPYKNSRKSTEPEHNVMEVEYGHVGKNLNPKPSVSFTPEQKAYIDKMMQAAIIKAATPIAEAMYQKRMIEEKADSNNTVETLDTTSDADITDENSGETEEVVNENIENKINGSKKATGKAANKK